MPIKIPNNLPATKTLTKENIFVMTENRAVKQDIRPLKIAILNLMPFKISAEIQLMRLLGNTPLQVDIDLIKIKNHEHKHTPPEHMATFYKTFDEIKNSKYDGLIINGAPVENLAFTDVIYWDELCKIMDWSTTNVTSTLHICWGAMAGLNYHYGIDKVMLDFKMFGIFQHKIISKPKILLRGFSDTFYAPHSRWSGIDENQLANCKDLEVLAYSNRAGSYLISSKRGKQIFVLGHPEYETTRIADEYNRDKSEGKSINLPYNYYPNDDDKLKPVNTWNAHSNLLFANWLNYYVYQITPFDVMKI